jgi:hypothetical protein
MCELCPDVFSLNSADVISKLAAPVIAGIVAYIAYLQWKLNKALVREKLFERRFEVFRSTQKFLTKISEKIDFDMSDLWEFSDAVQRSRFLFDEEIHTYLKAITDRALDLKLSTDLMTDPSESGNMSAHSASRSASAIWLNNQLSVIFQKFQPYLSFAKDY